MSPAETSLICFSVGSCRRMIDRKAEYSGSAACRKEHVRLNFRTSDHLEAEEMWHRVQACLGLGLTHLQTGGSCRHKTREWLQGRETRGTMSMGSKQV